MIIEISDWSAPELDIYARLTEAQLRNRLEPEKGLFIAESPKVISSALAAGCEPVSLLTTHKHIEGQARPILEKLDAGIPIYTGEDALLEKLTGYALTRGVLCAMRRPRLKTPAELLNGARRVAVPVNIVDSTNVGAIFRSAAALGMDAVLPMRCCDPLCRRSVRVSMGTVFNIPWTYLDSLGTLREAGFKNAAMALTDKSVSIEDERLGAELKLAIVLGTEGDGLPQETIEACDYTVKIPMAHGVDSLNVAAAAAVAFWALR